MANNISYLANMVKQGVSSVSDAYEDMRKKGMQQYNREQSRRSAGRYQQKETPEEYNRRKANEMMGIKEQPTGFASSFNRR